MDFGLWPLGDLRRHSDVIHSLFYGFETLQEEGEKVVITEFYPGSFRLFSGTGSSGSKSSLEQHATSPSDRRSKPILKKGDLRFDPETERLIDDGGSIGDGSSSRSGSVSSSTPAMQVKSSKNKGGGATSSSSAISSLKAPIKFVGVDDDSDSKFHTKLPKSPMPRGSGYCRNVIHHCFHQLCVREVVSCIRQHRPNEETSFGRYIHTYIHYMHTYVLH